MDFVQGNQGREKNVDCVRDNLNMNANLIKLLNEEKR